MLRMTEIIWCRIANHGLTKNASPSSSRWRTTRQSVRRSLETKFCEIAPFLFKNVGEFKSYIVPGMIAFEVYIHSDKWH